MFLLHGKLKNLWVLIWLSVICIHLQSPPHPISQSPFPTTNPLMTPDIITSSSAKPYNNLNMSEHIGKLFVVIIILSLFTYFERADYNLPLFAFSLFLWNHNRPVLTNSLSPKRLGYGTWFCSHLSSTSCGLAIGRPSGIMRTSKWTTRPRSLVWLLSYRSLSLCLRYSQINVAICPDLPVC